MQHNVGKKYICRWPEQNQRNGKPFELKIYIKQKRYNAEGEEQEILLEYPKPEERKQILIDYHLKYGHMG